MSLSALGRRVHEIRTIKMLQREVNKRYPVSFRALAGSPHSADHWPLVGKNLTTRLELFAMLLEAGQHGENALNQHPTAVPLDRYRCKRAAPIRSHRAAPWRP